MVIEEYYIRICSCMREPDLRDLSPRSFSSEKDFSWGSEGTGDRTLLNSRERVAEGHHTCGS